MGKDTFFSRNHIEEKKLANTAGKLGLHLQKWEEWAILHNYVEYLFVAFIIIMVHIVML